jgi:hypothetical protein
MTDTPNLRPLTDDERAWIETSADAMLQNFRPAVASVGFDDPPDGFLAVLHGERP